MNLKSPAGLAGRVRADATATACPHTEPTAYELCKSIRDKRWASHLMRNMRTQDAGTIEAGDAFFINRRAVFRSRRGRNAAALACAYCLVVRCAWFDRLHRTTAGEPRVENVH